MFVNGLPFLVTSLRGLSLVTIEHLPSRTAKRLVLTLERVFKIYATTGFIIQTALMDMEFEKTQAFNAPCGTKYHCCTRARRRDRTKDQGDQGEDKGYGQYSALQETTKDDGNRVTAFLCNVDELISHEVGHLRKMESTGVGIPYQAGC